jgi:oligoendopeptidase F
MTSVQTGVTWDLTSFFKEFNDPDMLAFKDTLRAEAAELQKQTRELGALTTANTEGWETIILKLEDCGARLGHIFSYVGCLTAAHAANEQYAQEEAGLALMAAEYNKVMVYLRQAFKDASDADFSAFCARPKLADVAFHLRRTREDATYTMAQELEMLATDLNVDGFHSWGRLYDTLSGKLSFDMVWPEGHEKAGQTEKLPISQWRSLMGNADRRVGKAAFDCGNKAWQGVEDTCAACLNAIAGTRLTLNKYRKVPHYMYKPLFQSELRQETLDAMYQAIHEHIEIARDIFRAKGGAMGRQGIYWFERESPLLLDASSEYTWEQGVTMVEKAFGTAYPALADYYRSFLAKRWMESEKRDGKRPGAFCTGSEVTNEQRVYSTFSGSIGDVTTMAHEIGHAWHGHLLTDLRPMRRDYPMTLAETASIFAEHILAEGVYTDPSIDNQTKLQMLDADLNGAAILLLDITVRYQFERAFHDERAKGEVGVSRFKQLMKETQRKVLGDSLMPDSEDEMFWASKLHFYITGVSFYNFPYTVGFLLARTLFTLFKQQGPAFLAKYEDFLRLTGSDGVEGVAKRALGVDVTDPAFWASAITSMREPLKQYRELLAANPLPAAAKAAASAG